MEPRQITIVRNGKAEVMQFNDPPDVVAPRPRRPRLQLMPALFVVLAGAAVAVLVGLMVLMG